MPIVLKRTVIAALEWCLVGLLAWWIAQWVTVHYLDNSAWLKIPPGYYIPSVNTSLLHPIDTRLKPLPLESWTGTPVVAMANRESSTGTAQTDKRLSEAMMAVISQAPPTLVPHVMYYNLNDHRMVSINADTPVASASVIKLPILWAYLQGLDRGDYSQNSHWIYEPFEETGGSGMWQFKPHNQPVRSVDVATSMIQISDNSCTNMMIYHLGGMPRLNADFRAWGLNQTELNSWLPDLEGTNHISARDMATLLYNLTTGSSLSDSSKALAIEILKGTHNRRLLAGLLPKDLPIAHKTGDIGTSLGDSGLFILPDGRRYILVIQVERPFNDGAAKTLIQQLSKVVYDETLHRTSTPIATPAAPVKPS